MQHSPTASATYHLLSVAGFISLFCILLIAGLQPFVPIEYLTGDPAAISGQPLYFGILSHIGVIFWIASAAVCLFSSALLTVLQIRSDTVRFLQTFGSLSALLGLDDLFLLHERAFPLILQVPQTLILLGYALTVLGCLCRFRKVLRKHQPLVFGLSLCLFFVSVLLDSLPLSATVASTALPPTALNTILHVLEDGAKLLAVFTWLTYFVWISIILVIEAVIEALDKKVAAPTVHQSASPLTEPSILTKPSTK